MSKKYEAKEAARLNVQDAVVEFFKAADANEMGAQEIADELANTIFDATDRTIKLTYDPQ